MSTTVITGGNRGIGLELCRQTSARGDDVIAVCRRSSAELRALGVRVESGVRVDDEASVAALAERLADQSIGLLINNAGVLKRETLASPDFASMREQFEVNALGPLRVTAALAPMLVDGGKVALVTSRMGSVTDNTSGGMYGYRMSKAALNIAGVSLARDLEARGVAVILLHPGHVATEMTGNTGAVQPADAAAGLLARIDELTLQRSGTFRHANGESLPW